MPPKTTLTKAHENTELALRLSQVTQEGIRLSGGDRESHEKAQASLAKHSNDLKKIGPVPASTGKFVKDSLIARRDRASIDVEKWRAIAGGGAEAELFYSNELRMEPERISANLHARQAQLSAYDLVIAEIEGEEP